MGDEQVLTAVRFDIRGPLPRPATALSKPPERCYGALWSGIC